MKKTKKPCHLILSRNTVDKKVSIPKNKCIIPLVNVLNNFNRFSTLIKNVLIFHIRLHVYDLNVRFGIQFSIALY